MAAEQFGKAFGDHLLEQSGREVSVVLNVAGKDVTFYEPTGGQIMGMAMLASQSYEDGSLGQMALDVSQLLMGLMDDDGQAHFRAALLHWSEPLPPDALAAIVRRLTEEWTARPTEPLSESSPSEQRDGTYSTANSRRVPQDKKGKAASSTSRRKGSAT